LTTPYINQYYGGHCPFFNKIEKNKMGVACDTYGRPEVKRPLGRPRGEWRTILKRIFKKENGKAWTGLI
jgi:hypothetical protein